MIGSGAGRAQAGGLSAPLGSLSGCLTPRGYFGQG